MSVNSNTDVQAAWTRLNGQWQGPHADGFYNKYVIRTTETVDNIERNCSRLQDISRDFAKELQSFEIRW